MARSLARLLAPACLALVTGCGGSGHGGGLNQAHPLYVAPAKHATRAPGTIYPDEVGENIVGLQTPYARVIKLFGQPLRHHGACVDYRLAGSPGRGWRFCFANGRMTSAAGLQSID